ncbi:MAG: hypothetical protein AAGA11_07080 [Pseudomonadota bacterium]
MARHALLLLLVVKGGLLVWGVLGFIEYVLPAVGFGLQDANFPRGVQFLHWFLLVSTGTTFVVGYVWRWRHTPAVTVTLYATLATLCFVETVDFNAFGGGDSRFAIMTAEFALYAVLSVFLLRSPVVRTRFG